MKKRINEVLRKIPYQYKSDYLRGYFGCRCESRNCYIRNDRERRYCKNVFGSYENLRNHSQQNSSKQLLENTPLLISADTAHD